MKHPKPDESTLRFAAPICVVLTPQEIAALDKLRAHPFGAVSRARVIATLITRAAEGDVM